MNARQRKKVRKAARRAAKAAVFMADVCGHREAEQFALAEYRIASSSKQEFLFNLRSEMVAVRKVAGDNDR